MEHYTPPPLDPILQSFHDLYNVLDPTNELTTLSRIQQGLRYCIANNCEPDQAILDLSTCEPFTNVQ